MSKGAICNSNLLAECPVAADLRARLAQAREALKSISDHSESQNLSHVDFRVQVRLRADAAIAGIAVDGLGKRYPEKAP